MIRMKDIAQKANVSRPTVSLVLNGKSGNVRISEETKKRIFDAAEKLGYCKNEIARSMITGKTYFIGFLSDQIDIEYIAKNLNGVIEESQRHGYLVKIFPMPAVNDAFEQCVKNMIGQRPAGIICRSLEYEKQKIIKRECEKFNIPVALIGSVKRENWGIRVLTDDAAGAGEAAKYLIRIGHSKILCVTNPKGMRFSDERYKGFVEEAKKSGIKVQKINVPEKDSDYKKLEKELIQIFKSPKRPTAIFCVTDELAMIALRAAGKSGLKVPDDLSVIGFADMRLAALANPPLTTVAEPFGEVGIIAARELIKEINAPSKNSFISPKNIELRVNMILRESTAPLKNKNFKDKL